MVDPRAPVSRLIAIVENQGYATAFGQHALLMALATSACEDRARSTRGVAEPRRR